MRSDPCLILAAKYDDGSLAVVRSVQGPSIGEEWVRNRKEREASISKSEITADPD